MPEARLAFGFLTRIPVGDVGVVDGDRLSRAAAWFPIVGALVGATAAGVHWAAGAVGVTPGPATLLALLAGVLVTGGFHEDGLADICDAWGAHVGRERKLEILRDSRVGTYGALAVAFALLFAYSALAGLDDRAFLEASIAGHVVGRWTTLPLSRLLEPARADGKGALVRAGWPGMAVATLFTAAVLIATGGARVGLIVLAATAVVGALTARVLQRSFGGGTGDGFGAVNKLCELATYAVFAAR